MSDTASAESTPVAFVVVRDDSGRNRLQDLVARTGCLAVPLPRVDNAILLLKNGAQSNLVLLASDALDDDTAPFDLLMDAVGQTAKVIIYGGDPAGAVVLHCLNKGASDFIPETAQDDEIMNAVEAAAFDRLHTGAPAHADAITASSHVSGWIELTASSELEQLRRLQRFSDALFATHLPESVCEDLKMVVEEVGRNAVEWGNNFAPDKQVHISYAIFNNRIVIKVEDEGEGFSPAALTDPTIDPLKTMRERQSAGKRAGGYGVFLIKKLVDDIVYNEKGNTVLLIKYLPEI
ncbi:MAG: ATP-binding protein [Planctomycetaceae bacterium]|nr:ATP-binding protein [Planctomycetaceae bacterium]